MKQYTFKHIYSDNISNIVISINGGPEEAKYQLQRIVRFVEHWELL